MACQRFDLPPILPQRIARPCVQHHDACRREEHTASSPFQRTLTGTNRSRWGAFQAPPKDFQTTAPIRLSKATTEAFGAPRQGRAGRRPPGASRRSRTPWDSSRRLGRRRPTEFNVKILAPQEDALVLLEAVQLPFLSQRVHGITVHRGRRARPGERERWHCGPDTCTARSVCPYRHPGTRRSPFPVLAPHCPECTGGCRGRRPREARPNGDSPTLPRPFLGPMPGPIGFRGDPVA